MPGLIRTRHALATRRRSSGHNNNNNHHGKPEPAAAAPTDDSATDPLDDSTSVHRRMDLLLAKSASVEEPPSAPLTCGDGDGDGGGDGGGDGDLLRASTAGTVPGTVVDGTPPKPAEQNDSEEKESRVIVKHTGASARLTPAPAPAPPPAPAKLETSTSSASSACTTSSRSSAGTGTTGRRRSLKSAMARTCADTATAPAPSTPKSPQKTVQFSHLEIRTYPVTLGDNPSVSSGPPLALDWNYTTAHTFAVDAYERQRPPASRRQLAEMAVPQSLRIEMLCEDARISLRTIEAQCREVERCKKQRRRTVERFHSAWLCRAVKKMAPACRSGRRT